METANLEAELHKLQQARDGIAQVVVGQETVVDQLLMALMCGGHVLLEAAPGMGKTLLVRTTAAVFGMQFSRVQFTPDLMPADITGTVVLLHDELGKAQLEFQPGPIFAQMVLADEINRSTPKTQSALLEAMQEHTVTVAGKVHSLPEPFFVLATQNPIEQEGTYMLPEAQVDRFLFKVQLPYPTAEMLTEILERTTGSTEARAEQVLNPQQVIHLQQLTRAVPMASHVRDAVVKFVLATQPQDSRNSRDVQRYVRFGVSPRGAQALILAAKAHALLQGRYNVAFSDLEAVLLPSLRHRFNLNFEGQAEGIQVDPLLQKLFKETVGGPKA